MKQVITKTRVVLTLFCLLIFLGTTTANAQCPAGSTWTSRTSAADNLWRSVTYGNGLFVAVASSGTGNRVMSSPDGITWTSRTSAADNLWGSVTYGNGLFVAVASTGTGNRVMTSLDGITWTIRTSAANNDWTSVTYGNGLFVAVAASGTGNRVMTSPNGITWTIRTSAGDNLWRSVTYGNGLFVAVGASGTVNRVMTSPDGITWTIRTAAGVNGWLSIIYGNGLFVAVASDGFGNRVMTSPDGITWTSRASAVDNGWGSITYGDGLFVAVSRNGTGNGVMTSPDGITWTSRTPAADNSWTSVTYGNGLFLTVADSGTGNRVMTSSQPLVTPSVTIAANPGNSISFRTSVTFTATPTNGGNTPAYQWKKNGNNVGTNSVTYTDAALENGDLITCVLTSNDPCASPITATSPSTIMVVNYPCPAGTTWTSRTSAATSTWQSVTYGNGLFVAVAYAASGTSNKVMTSPDGITWTSRTAAVNNDWLSVTYGNGLFVAVAQTGTGNRVMTSSDGITWTSRTSAANNGWISVTYGNGLFVAVAPTGTGNRVMTSPDGITWTSRASAADNNWSSVTYGNGLFVAVAASGTGNRVMTSPDGITWTIRTSVANNFNFWRSVTYGNGLFVAVAQSGTGNRVMTSPNGINWTIRTSAADNEWNSVTYGNGLFVAVAISGTGNRVMTSPDGINWTSRTSAANYIWQSVTYGNGVFVAVAASAVTNNVMTSSPPLVTPSITIAANPGNSITTGTSVTFTATPTNGGSTPAYQWKKNGNNVGTDSVTYTNAALINGDSITCVLTSNDPCASPATATSSAITMVVAASSTITTTAALSAFTSCAGTASAQQSFNVSGANLTANIIVTPPTGFELSTISGSGFTSSVTLTQSGGSVASTTVYARITASASGTISGNISCVSTGATTKNVAVSGNVNPSTTPTFTAVASICSGATLAALPTTSNNGITGTWLPALNNTTTTTYTFTPTAGQCSNTATMTITVNATPAPTASAQTYNATATVGNLVATGTALKWYTVPTGGTNLPTSTPLVSGTYYISQTLNGCESARTSVAVTLASLYTAIPDANFEQALFDQGIDTVNGDNQVLTSAISGLKLLDVSYKDIASLTGIEAFSSLTELNCSGNLLTNLNVSGLTGLEYLTCSNNQLTSLNTTNLTALTSLDCSNNLVSSLSLTTNTKLIWLQCQSNQITSLNLSGLVTLQTLWCSYNQLTSLNASGTDLRDLNCSNNYNETVEPFTYLTNINLTGLSDLTNLNCAGNLMLANLNFLGLSNLNFLDLSYNNFSTINLSSLTNLWQLDISNNKLTALDLSSNPISSFNSFSNTALSCISVLDIALAENAGWSVDSWSTFKLPAASCLYTLIPDANFEQALIDLGHDTIIDGKVLTSSVTGIITLDVSNKSISYLNGIKSFTALQHLNCSSNGLNTLDIVGLSNLKTIDCSSNSIGEFLMTNTTNLTSLNCSFNSLESLNLSGLTNLNTLVCGSNQISTLNLTGLTNLITLNCFANQISTLNFTGLAKLATLDCSNNPLPNLSFSALTTLSNLDCSSTQRTSLNVSGLNNLVSLSFSGNQLTSMNLSNLSKLKTLDCAGNLLTTVNLNGLTVLETLYCGRNQFTSLSLTNMPTLKNLYCSGSRTVDFTDGVLTSTIVSTLTSLTLTGLTNLEELNCDQNKLTAMNLTGLTSLKRLSCGDNNFTTLSLNASNFPSLVDLYCPVLFPAPKGNLTSLELVGFSILEKINCERNSLSTLNLIGLANSALVNCTQNPSLTCITVSDPIVAASNTLWSKDATASYSTNCNEASTGATAAVLSGSTAICSGNTANINIAITGGTSPYTVVYFNGVANATVTGYVSGTAIPVSPTTTATYTIVSVTDAASNLGTGNSGTVVVTVNPNVTPPFTQVAPICNGAVLAALPTTANNGITGTWAPAIDNTATTTYTFTPDAGQCAIATTMTIVINPNPIVTFGANPFPVCVGTSTVLTAYASNLTPTVNFTDLSATNQSLSMIAAAFGVPVTSPLTGILALAPSDGCAAFTPGLFAGKIALIQRGTCSFAIKAQNAQDAGAIGVLIYNNAAGNLNIGGAAPTVTIPVYGITQADDLALIAAMTANEVSVTLAPSPTLTYVWSNGSLTQTTNTGVLNVDTDFSVTVTNPATGCSTLQTVTVPVTANTIPTFTQVAPICTGGTLAALPTTSDNGLAGTWSPALDNTITTTYTFIPIPVTGQCLGTATMTITVNQPSVPSFTQVAPICNGAVLAALPTTANNGVTGTWAPAIDNTATTTYTFTTDAGQCAITASMTITVTPNVLYYADNDGDGFGNPAVSQQSCTGAPTGYVTNNTDCNDNNNAATTAIVISNQPTNATICKAIGGADSFTVATSAATATYKWYSQAATATTWTALANTANYSGSTTATLNITKTTTTVPATGTKYKVVANNSCGTLTSAIVTLTDLTVLSKAATISVVGTLSPLLTTCQGNSVNLLLAAGSVGNIQWQSSTDGIIYSNVGSVIAQTALSATNAAIPFTTAALTQTTWFRVVASNGVCNSINGTPIKINVSSPANPGKINGGDVTVCAPLTTGIDANGNALTTALTNSTSLSLGEYTQGATIVWQKSVNFNTATPTWAAAGSTTNTFTATALTADTWYRALVTNGACTATTAVTKIKVDKAAKAGTTTSTTNGVATASVCTGGDITFTSAAYTGTAIQWEVSTTSATTGFVPIEGATGTSFTMNNIGYAALSKFYIRSVVTSGACTLARSAVKTITVNPTSVGGTATGGGTICSGSNNTLKLAGNTGTIQWQSSADGIDFVNVTGTAATYIATNITATTYFRAKITSGACSEAYSNMVQYTIGTAASSGTLTAAAPTVCSGTGTTVTLAAAVGTIKWLKSTNWTTASPTWTAVTTSTTGTLATGNLTASTAFKAEASIGSCSTVTTEVVPVLVYAAPLAKTITATVSSPTGATSLLAICTTSSISKVLTIGAGSNGAIQWQKSTTSTTTGFTDIPNATATSYTIANPAVGVNYYRAKFTNSCGLSVYSAAFTVYYKNCSVIAKMTEAKVVPAAAVVPFEVLAYPNPFTSTFNLELITTSSENVQVNVYDAIGKLVETRNVPVSEVGNKEVGSNYPTGVYNITISQGTEMKTLRVMKKY